MRAMVCSSFDGPAALTLGELPEPQPCPGDVLVEVHAASLRSTNHWSRAFPMA